MTVSATTTVQRDWIATEFSKGLDAEQALIDEARARAESPPDPSFQVLYHEIAAADERHKVVIETIATRYGHNPVRSVAGGIGETLGKLKDKVGSIGSSPLQTVAGDLAAKANAIHWYIAWIHAFELIGDTDSSKALATVLEEETSHRDALQEGLNRLVAVGATGEPVSAK